MTVFDRLRTTDLNLLPILRELLRRRTVTGTGQALHMSQPAISEALKRLRLLFGDDLLVRSGRTMQLTPLAHQLVPTIEQALNDLESILTPPPFDPAAVNRQFIIATADSIVLTIGGALVRRLADEAPGMSVQCVDLQWVDERALHSGELDFIIMPQPTVDADGPANPTDTAGMDSFLVYEEEFVCIARKGHPATRSGVALEYDTTIAYRAHPGSRLFGPLPGRRRADQILVPQFSLLGSVLDLVARSMLGVWS